MQARERLEQLGGEPRVEAGAVVGDGDRPVPSVELHGDLDARVGAPARELPGVADEVLESDAQQVGVAAQDHVGRDDDAHLAPALPPAQLRDDVGRDGAHVHDAAVQRPARQPREAEEVVDELSHALALLADDVDVLARAGRERVPVILEEGERESVDAPQRGAQIVGDAVAEGLELAVGRRELGRALGDAALEVGVEAHDLGLLVEALDLRAGAHGREREDEADGVEIGERLVVERGDEAHHAPVGRDDRDLDDVGWSVAAHAPVALFERREPAAAPRRAGGGVGGERDVPGGSVGPGRHRLERAAVFLESAREDPARAERARERLDEGREEALSRVAGGSLRDRLDGLLGALAAGLGLDARRRVAHRANHAQAPSRAFEDVALDLDPAHGQAMIRAASKEQRLREGATGGGQAQRALDVRSVAPVHVSEERREGNAPRPLRPAQQLERLRRDRDDVRADVPLPDAELRRLQAEAQQLLLALEEIARLLEVGDVDGDDAHGPDLPVEATHGADVVDVVAVAVAVVEDARLSPLEDGAHLPGAGARDVRVGQERERVFAADLVGPPAEARRERAVEREDRVLPIDEEGGLRDGVDEGLEGRLVAPAPALERLDLAPEPLARAVNQRGDRRRDAGDGDDRERAPPPG